MFCSAFAERTEVRGAYDRQIIGRSVIYPFSAAKLSDDQSSSNKILFALQK